MICESCIICEGGSGRRFGRVPIAQRAEGDLYDCNDTGPYCENCFYLVTLEEQEWTEISNNLE